MGVQLFAGKYFKVRAKCFKLNPEQKQKTKKKPETEPKPKTNNRNIIK